MTRHCKSIEERVRSAQQDLTLMIAALSVDTDGLEVSTEEVVGAAITAANRAYEELYWLAHLPAHILKEDAPTDDEREDSDAPDGGGR